MKLREREGGVLQKLLACQGMMSKYMILFV